MSSAECGALGRCADSGGMRKCQPRATRGGDCVFDDDCAFDLVCTALGPDATCQPRGEVGDLCTGGACVLGTYCRAEPLPSYCEARVCSHFSFIEL